MITICNIVGSGGVRNITPWELRDGGLDYIKGLFLKMEALRGLNWYESTSTICRSESGDVIEQSGALLGSLTISSLPRP